MNSATVTVLLKNGAEKTVTINGVGNAESLKAAFVSARQNRDAIMSVGAVTGGDELLDANEVAHVGSVTYNPDA